jgi:hypothetical protein
MAVSDDSVNLTVSHDAKMSRFDNELDRLQLGAHRDRSSPSKLRSHPHGARRSPSALATAIFVPWRFRYAEPWKAYHRRAAEDLHIFDIREVVQAEDRPASLRYLRK